MVDRYIGCAENDEDVLSAIRLIKKVFYAEIGHEKFLFPKEHLVEKNVVVIKENNVIVASSLIYDRLLYFKNEKIPCSFLSFICVDDFYRNKGLSRRLMDFSIELCKDRGKKACFVIARKAVDFYYNKFSFYGFSNYPKIEINFRESVIRKKLNFVPLNPFVSNEIEKIYNDVYFNLLGAFFRSKEHWNFIVQKAKNNNIEVCEIQDLKSNSMGYICFKRGDIFEIALKNPKDYPEVLKNLMEKEKMNSIIFHGGENHPLANELNFFDHTISYRKCCYGGHMIRINDEKLFKNIFSNEIKNIPLMDQI